MLGVVSAVVMAICGFFLEKPGKDFAPPAAASVKKKYVNPVAMEAGTGEMLKKPAFWLYYLWAILLSAAGLALVSQASAIAKEVGPTVSIGTITTVVGLISIFNGIGRVILGGLFDKVGRSGTMPDGERPLRRDGHRSDRGAEDAELPCAGGGLHHRAVWPTAA